MAPKDSRRQGTAKVQDCCCIRPYLDEGAEDVGRLEDVLGTDAGLGTAQKVTVIFGTAADQPTQGPAHWRRASDCRHCCQQMRSRITPPLHALHWGAMYADLQSGAPSPSGPVELQHPCIPIDFSAVVQARLIHTQTRLPPMSEHASSHSPRTNTSYNVHMERPRISYGHSRFPYSGR